MKQAEPTLKEQLLTQTGRIPWRELERHFARGAVWRVDDRLDLVEVAVALAEDRRREVQAWMDEQQLVQADMDDAAGWHRDQAELWAVVVAPWVLVQNPRP